MNYKHGKFDDSPIMRSLEKVAREKGWVESNPITKLASNELNLSPSSNLTDNVLKLCAGLRKSGLDKYATDIENKYVAFKQAATLYEAHDEKGEDLVDRAHPDGAHKLDGVANHVVDTIFTQHLKNLQMVNKSPTGKLSNAKDILRAVKIVLAQQMPSIPENISEMTEDDITPFRMWGALAQLKQVIISLDKARAIIQNKMNTTTLASSFDNNYNDISAKINTLSPQSINVKDIDSVISDLGYIKNSINFFNWKDLEVAVPGVGALSILRHVGDLTDMATGDWDQKLRDQISGIVNESISRATLARNNLRGSNDAAIKAKLVTMKSEQEDKMFQEKAKDAPQNELLEKIKKAQMGLNDISQIFKVKQRGSNPKTIKEMSDWIKYSNEALLDLEKKYTSMSPEGVRIALNAITEDFARVIQEWS